MFKESASGLRLDNLYFWQKNASSDDSYQQQTQINWKGILMIHLLDACLRHDQISLLR